MGCRGKLVGCRGMHRHTLRYLRIPRDFVGIPGRLVLLKDTYSTRIRLLVSGVMRGRGCSSSLNSGLCWCRRTDVRCVICTTATYYVNIKRRLYSRKRYQVPVVHKNYRSMGNRDLNTYWRVESSPRPGLALRVLLPTSRHRALKRPEFRAGRLSVSAIDFRCARSGRQRLGAVSKNRNARIVWALTCAFNSGTLKYARAGPV